MRRHSLRWSGRADMGSRGTVGSAGGVEAVVSAISSQKYCRGSWTLPISTLSDIGQMFDTLVG
jgi:hypothetical protein